MVGTVALAQFAAYEIAWTLWDRIRKTLKRAAIAPAEEVVAFRSNTSAIVTMAKGSSGWLRISSKLHILMIIAPDAWEMWGSIGLCGE